MDGDGAEPEPYLLLYVGRRDETKNIWLLLAYLREYWARRGTPLKLLLAGRDPIDLPRNLEPLVYDLGFLSEQQKHDAYASADLFVQPSLYESFSIVLMEAWLQGTGRTGACGLCGDGRPLPPQWGRAGVQGFRHVCGRAGPAAPPTTAPRHAGGTRKELTCWQHAIGKMWPAGRLG